MQEEYRGYTIEIKQDTSDMTPRDWDNLATMYYRSRNWTLGDTIIPESYYSDKHGDTMYVDDYDSFVGWITETVGEIAVILPLFVYEHSGITMRCYPFSDRWDSGQVGWIVVTKEDIRKNWNTKRVTKKLIADAKRIAENEVKTFDQYISGDVYGYMVNDPEGKSVDSCWGYYGYDDTLKEAQSVVDYDIEEKHKKHLEQAKKYIKSGVPLQYRFAG